MVTHVQLIATVPVFNAVQIDTRWATPEEIADGDCLWSVYVGEPGGFSWLADFADHIDAEAFAGLQVQLHNAQLIEGIA